MHLDTFGDKSNYSHQPVLRDNSLYSKDPSTTQVLTADQDGDYEVYDYSFSKLRPITEVQEEGEKASAPASPKAHFNLGYEEDIK